MQTTQNNIETTSVSTRVHPFEKAELGVAPFRLVRVYESKFQACQGAPIQPGTSCDYCGTGIMYVFVVKGATGREFKVGCDCVEKVDQGPLAHAVSVAAKRMKAEAKAEREAAAGKRKAQDTLEAAGLTEAWGIWAEEDTVKRYAYKYEETTIVDIVGKLVRYGSVSEKSLAYVGRMLEAIKGRAAKEEAKAAEQAAALDCPKGRVTVRGTVLSTKVVYSDFGSTEKMLVKTAEGWKVWGTVPGHLAVDKGYEVTFSAQVEPSKDDPKFGFYSRPTQARITKLPEGVTL